MRVFLFIIALLIFGANISIAQTSPSFDCAKASTEVERLVCSDSSLAELDVKVNDAYKEAVKSLSKENGGRLTISQDKWKSNLQNQSFLSLNSYDRRVFYLSELYKERIKLLKSFADDANNWDIYRKKIESESKQKSRYLSQINQKYSDVCSEVSNFLENKDYKIAFSSFKSSDGSEEPYSTGISSAKIDINNDNVDEYVMKFITSPAGTSTTKTQQIVKYSNDENMDILKDGKRILTDGRELDAEGAIEFFTFNNELYLFHITPIIDNNDQITDYYKNNNLNNSNMDYLRLAKIKIINDEDVVYLPAPITIRKYLDSEFTTVCEFKTK